MASTLDPAAVRTWCRCALRALGQARENIDAINVYPVPDGDTGTNLYLTVESAAQAVEAVFEAHATTAGGPGPSFHEALRALSHGALIGARGNSGTILAQLLRGLHADLAAPAPAPGPSSAAASSARGSAPAPAPAEAAPPGAAGDGDPAEALRRAFGAAAASAYEAVARPVEGTMLTVATAAARAARACEGGVADVVRAAHEGARDALAATPGQLGALRQAGVVDAGGLGLVALLGALCRTVTGDVPAGPPGARTTHPTPLTRAPRNAGPAGTAGSDLAPMDAGPAPQGVDTGPAPMEAGSAVSGAPPMDAGSAQPGVPPIEAGLAVSGEAADLAACVQDGNASPKGSAFEVLFLLEAADEAAVQTLRARLDALGDSLVVVGGDGLWNIHVHVPRAADVGTAIEAGIDAGRPYRIRVTHFGDQTAAAPDAGQPGRRSRAVVALVPGGGLADLCAEAGATVVAVRPGERPAGGEIAAAIRRAGAREVVLLPNDTELRDAAAAAAQQARADGVRVALIPTRSAVQGLAALAVHEPGRRFDEDVVAMTAAAGATRYGELAVAERQSWTTAGVCQAGDVLGLIDGDVAVIGGSLQETAVTVLDRMLAAGGELVTLVLGPTAPPGLGGLLEAHVQTRHLAVDTVTYSGGEPGTPLQIGVE
ncbi:DAK2 domain-containing protein [Actinacidiphila yeochonensis]|uniref:DAK2 domain-containing protein n=1 Tax=Actinacidiphila yeochonensis TaxID=89050 RepID=UPI00055F011D|nr:DAK2 domain-containing protein [Actinacidiphila yeochonensis]